MTQAEYLILKKHLDDVKRELKYMPTELEKTNLEAHVDLCSERYERLHDRLSGIEVRLGKINDDMKTGHKSNSKTVIAAAGTVIAGLLSTMVVLLIKLN
jgi:tetrahydromethanopterin S-methyltransferase subunit G